MMTIKKYFVQNGRVISECVTDYPANPDGYDLVSIEEIAGKLEDYVIENGEAKFLPASKTALQIKVEALQYLASTDWYVIRHQETGKEIPVGILAARQAARDSIE